MNQTDTASKLIHHHEIYYYSILKNASTTDLKLIRPPVIISLWVHSDWSVLHSIAPILLSVISIFNDLSMVVMGTIVRGACSQLFNCFKTSSSVPNSVSVLF